MAKTRCEEDPLALARGLMIGLAISLSSLGILVLILRGAM